MHSSCRSCIFYRKKPAVKNDNDVNVALQDIAEEETPLVDAPVLPDTEEITPVEPETDTDTIIDIPEAEVPLAPVPSTNAVPAGNVEDLQVELDALEEVLTIIDEQPVATTPVDNSAAEAEAEAARQEAARQEAEAARQAAEAARQEAEAQAARVAAIQSRIDSLKQQLLDAKANTESVQLTLTQAQEEYSDAIADANAALATAQDAALAYYNMKYEGIAKLNEMITDDTVDENGNTNKIYAYFSTRTHNNGSSLDSTGGNFGAVAAESLNTELTTTVENTATADTTDTTEVALEDAKDAGNECGFRIYQNYKKGELTHDIIWTEVDYSDLAENSIIPAYHYNAQTGFFTLTSAKVLYRDLEVDGQIVRYAYITTGVVDPNGTGVDGNANVCLNPDAPYSSANDVLDLKADSYDESMESYNQDAIDAAEADGTATDTAHDTLNSAVNSEVSAIESETAASDELKAAMEEMAAATNTTLEDVASENEIDLTVTVPEATPEQIEAAKNGTEDPAEGTDPE